MPRWSSSVARVRAAAAVLVLATLAALGGCGDNRPGGDTRLTFAPAAATVPAGRDRTLVVEYIGADGQPGSPDAITFTSRAPRIATVTRAADGSAVVHGVAIGPAVIEARVDDDALDASALISVVEPEIDSLAIAPPAVSVPDGTCALITVTATASDGSTMVIEPDRVEWSSLTGLAVVSDGSVCALRQGDDTVRARYQGATAEVAVTATEAIPIAIDMFVPSPLLRVGGMVDARAFSRWSDGRSEEVSALSVWSSDRPEIATVSSTGLVTGVDIGTAHISAQFGSLTGTVAIQVLTPVVVDLFLDPSEAVVGVTGLVQFTATAIYNDNTFEDVTQTATWTSDDTSIATVDRGLARGQNLGDTAIHVVVPGFSRSAFIHVLP